MDAKNLLIICPISITDACLAAMDLEIVCRPNLDRLGALRCMKSALDTLSPVGSWAERGSSAQVLQTSIFSAISRASSTSTPRYRTVLSIFVWPSSS